MGGKTLDIVAYSILYMYDVDKTQNSILQMPYLHTPPYHSSQNVHNTMGDITDQKLATTNLFCVFGGSIFAHPSPDILTKHNIKETASKGNIWGPCYIPKGEGSSGG